MVAFDRQNYNILAISIKQRYAITQAKGQHPDMKLKHPDWCRDASKGDYTMLKKHIKDECLKKQEKNIKFRSKLHAK